jgi:2-polyprenyl-6-methoxyphenol hydroxylase-like FAD-dependent oxidoreductase
VDGLVVSGGGALGGRVIGVRVRARETPAGTAADGNAAGNEPETDGAAHVANEGDAVTADLVVDAGGRGSRTPAWLKEAGYPEPPVTELRTDVTYVTRHYQASPDQLNGLLAAVYTPYPGKHRGGALVRQEGDQWVVLIAGMLGEDPPASDESYGEYAEGFAGQEMATVVKSSEPLDDPVKMRFPGSVRRHYEKLGQFPDGLIVTGDALCSFNPVYGQGMTVAALEALALRRLIADGGAVRLPARFTKSAAKIVDEAWALSACGDLRFPQVEGRRQLAGRIARAYLDRFRPAASIDPVLGKAFVRVANMIDPPAKLLSPGNVVRVLRAPRTAAAFQRRRAQYASINVSG